MPQLMVEAGMNDLSLKDTAYGLVTFRTARKPGGELNGDQGGPGNPRTDDRS